jgi:DNA-binding transcriptional ArsR family regulator
MSSLQQLLDEDRRLVILRCLSEAHDYALNESLIEKMLARLRLGVVGRDVVRAHLAWLETHGLVTVDKLEMGGGGTITLWVGKLTRTGLEVAQGRPWPGVARPSPG